MLLRCQIKQLASGDILWIARQKEDKDKRIIEFLSEPVPTHLLTTDNRLYDLRETNSIPGISPFVVCLPCPYCFCEDERQHISEKHTYPQLGIPLNEVQKLASSPDLNHLDPQLRPHQAYLMLSQHREANFSPSERLDFFYGLPNLDQDKLSDLIAPSWKFCTGKSNDTSSPTGRANRAFVF